jgi:predicted MFS family arabinose efflux permease
MTLVAENSSSGFDETSLRYAGWRVVLACFLVALFIFGFGLYGHGVYVAELQRLHGWPAALISSASSLTFLLSSIFATFTSELMARLGSKRLILLGIAALSGSTILLAFATNPWQLYVAFILMSLGWTGMGVVVIATIVSSWFVHRRGLAISIAFNGASCGGVVVAPLLLLLVEKIGFPAAMLTATTIMVVVLIPVVLAWTGPRQPTIDLAERRTQCSSAPQTPDAQKNMTRAMIMRRLAFWTISVPFALALVAQIGFIVHQIALLEPKVGRPGAGFAVALTTSMAVIGRLCLGMVVDRLNPRLVTAVSLVSQAAALLAITQTDNATALFAACSQRNRWRSWPWTCRPRSQLERRLCRCSYALHRAGASCGGGRAMRRETAGNKRCRHMNRNLGIKCTVTLIPESNGSVSWPIIGGSSCLGNQGWPRAKRLPCSENY